MNFRSIPYTVGCLIAGLATVAAASATTLNGTFATDDQMFNYTWTLPQATSVTAYTTSYASGGFVPVLSLFDASGTFIAVDGGDASCSNGRMTDSTTGICNDAYLHTSLAAGSYSVVLTEFSNFPNGNYSAGFSEQGAGNFTAAACGTTGAFLETDLAPCVQRTGSYSLSLSTASATTPEPATAWLNASGFGISPPIVFASTKRELPRYNSSLYSLEVEIDQQYFLEENYVRIYHS